MVPFSLCRPAFEGLQRGRPGLTMAVFRYAVLTIPFAFAGMTAARVLGRPPLYGLLVGLIGASGLASAVFFTWMRRFMGALEAQERPAAPRARSGPAGQPGAARFSAPAPLSGEPPAPLSARQDAPEN